MILMEAETIFRCLTSGDSGHVDMVYFAGILAQTPQADRVQRTYLPCMTSAVETLNTKRDEIVAAIARYERKTAEARLALEHITATIALFEASGERPSMSTYVDLQTVTRW